ncbi:hypothetical protein [Halopseudomonas sp.]|uniref:hypothetical protein n=1 Tax=Halopseudomonas sp. TaxID=2901191 RepID=UPI0035690558
MPALLIVCGFFLLVLGWLWVALAARKLPIARFLLALLAAPVTLIVRRRGYARLPRLLILVGLILILAGVALLQREQPDRFHQLLAGEWATPANSGIGIDGVLMGQPFRPDRVLWRSNELVFEEGPPERIRRALAIRFAAANELLVSRTIERLPGDTGPWPELLLQWHTGALSEPGLLRVTDDYTLSLDFVPLPGQSTRVQLRLHLPTTPATLLSGEATLASSPAWLVGLQESVATPAAPVIKPPANKQSSEVPARSQWQDVSILAVLDESQFFTGQQVRLTTHAGRTYEGRLKTISADRRIVLAQSSGANQVDYHFRPADVLKLQVLYR